MSHSERASPKDPSAVIDMSVDFATHYLADGETISDQEVTSENTDITISAIGEADGVVRWRVSGGLAGTTPVITCSITTSAGRAEPFSIQLPIREL